MAVLPGSLVFDQGCQRVPRRAVDARSKVRSPSKRIGKEGILGHSRRAKFVHDIARRDIDKPTGAIVPREATYSFSRLLQPKTAFSRFSPVYRGDPEGLQRVDLKRSQFTSGTVGLGALLPPTASSLAVRSALSGPLLGPQLQYGDFQCAQIFIAPTFCQSQ